MAERNSRCG